MMFLRTLLVACATVCCLGCTSTQTASQATEQSNLKGVAVFYSRFVSQNRGRAPANEAEFRKFVESLGPEELKSFNLKSVDDMFVSNRDNQPYVIIYGPPKGPPLGPGGRPIIAYEQQGVGGKRYVASEIGGVEEVDEARFKELVPSAAS